MELSEALLIVVIILLIISVMNKNKGNNDGERVLNCVDKDGGTAQIKISGHGSACRCPPCAEAAALATNMNTPGETHVVDDQEHMQGESGFDGGDLSYKDYITSMAVDPQTLKNHMEFTRDRLKGQNEIVTGRTYAMGEIEGQSINWIGIRGPPQRIPESAMGNPTSVPDSVRDSDYAANNRLVWRS